MIKVKLSQIAILISFLVIGYINLNNKYWRIDNKVIESDVISYYSYLPSIFIYGDASLKFLEGNNIDPQVQIWATKLNDGARVIKMTMGVSYFYLPFFLVAHQYATLTDYNANGYSLPYRLAIIFSSIFFFIWALLIIRKYLLFFFDEKIVFWTILIIGIGTNIVNYLVKEVGMSHVYSFFLISVFIYYVHIWYKSFQLKHLLLIGFVSGLIVLVRPTNMLVLLFFIFYGVNSISVLNARIKLFISKYKDLLIAAVVGLIAILPQLFYWKYNTGNWIFYSYTDEHFFFNDSKIIDGLFSYRKGWLVYTPLMVLSLVGLFINNRKANQYKYVFFVFLAFYFYITFAWWCWWYGGSFGMRSLIDIYPLLALPIGVILDKVFKLSKVLKLGFIVLILSLIYLNLFQNYQYREGMLHFDAMTKESYWLMWGETEVTREYYEALDYTDAEAAKRGER